MVGESSSTSLSAVVIAIEPGLVLVPALTSSTIVVVVVAWVASLLV